MTSALIVRTIHKHNNTSQTISLKGQTQTIKAVPNTHYLITDSAGISPKNIKVKRHNNDLIISDTDDETSLVIEDYYSTDDTALVASIEGAMQTYQPTAQLGDDIWTLPDSPKALWWENVAGKALISGVLTGGLLTALKSDDNPSQHNTQTTPPTPPTPANQAPTASDGNEQTQESQALNGQLTATDPDGDPMSYALTNNATHGTVIINPDGSYHYTPNDGYYGTDSFDYTVSDDKGNSNTYTVNIDVTSINEQAPQIAPYKKSTLSPILRKVLIDKDDNVITISKDTLGRFIKGIEPDLTFGGTRQLADGISKINLNLEAIGHADFDKEGNILVFGRLHNDTHISIIRFKPDGTLDTSFNAQGSQAGVLPTSITAPDGFSIDDNIQLDSQGRIVVREIGGNSFERYHANGTPDTSFNKFNFNPEYPIIAFTLDNNDKIIGVSHSLNDGDIEVIRLNTDGTPDTSFNGTGTTKVSIPLNYYNYFYIADITADKDNKIIIATWKGDGKIIRLNTDGTPDTSFNPNGTTPSILIDDRIYVLNAISTDSKGRIIAVGESDGSYVARYLADGTPDASFNSGSTSNNGFIHFPHKDRTVLFNTLINSNDEVIAVGINPYLIKLNGDGGVLSSFSGISSDLDNGAGTFLAQGNAKALHTSIQVSDEDSNLLGHYGGTSLTLQRRDGANTDDVFGATGNLKLQADGKLVLAGEVIGTYHQQQGKFELNFNQNADKNDVNQALQSITYRNTGNGSIEGNQTIWFKWEFRDGDPAGSKSAVGYQELSITSSWQTTHKNTALNTKVPTIADGTPTSEHTIAEPPKHGNITLNTDGSYEYVPYTDYIGTDQFRYTGKDANGDTQTYTVNINVERGYNNSPYATGVIGSNPPILVHTDNLGNDGSATPDDDLGAYLYASSHKAPIEFGIHVDTLPTNNSTLSVRAFDIDYTQGERDSVYFNDKLVGYLMGGNGIDSLSTFNITPDLVKVGQNIVKVDIDPNGWATTVYGGGLTPNQSKQIIKSEDNQDFNYTLPTGIFADPDGDALTLSAVLTNGNDLPSWLNFDGNTGTFFGKAPVGFAGDIDVQVIANDGFGGMASIDYLITII